MRNYTPISLLAVFNKILEKVMHKRLSQHLHINKTLLLEQLGFSKGTSNEKCCLQAKCILSLNQK